jgi:hypothetical protein
VARKFVSLERISGFCSQSPDLKIFAAHNADEYIFLLFEIERHMDQESKSKLLSYQVTSIIREFYAKTDLLDIEMKTSNLLRNYIDVYQVFRDFYEGKERYISFTSLGRELLSLVSGRISESPRLSGLSIEQFFNDITALAKYDKNESREQRIQKAKEQLAELSERILKAESGDEEALAELGTQMSPEEYLVDAERQQQYTLLAGEDVKKAIKDTRQEILQSAMSVGRNIKSYSDFNELLKSKPAYKSYVRATDLVSYIDALSAKNPYKNVSRALRKIQDQGIIPDDRILSTSLWHFNHQFDILKAEIADEENTNLRILASQVRVTTSLDGKKLTEDLKEFINLMVNEPEISILYFDENTIDYLASEPVGSTEYRINSFPIKEKIKADPPIEDTVTLEDRRLVAQQLAEAEEKTFKATMRILRRKLKDNGKIKISDLEFNSGLMEFIFVYFAADLDGSFVESTFSGDTHSFKVVDKKGSFRITNLKDKLLTIKEGN